MLRAAISVAIVLAMVFLAVGCSVFNLVNVLVPRGDYVLHDGFAYGPFERQQVDVYEPRISVIEHLPGGYPLVVFFYGGSWTSGERGDYRFVGEALASRGIVAVIADYRLYPQASYPEFLHDCAAAIGWAIHQAPRFGADRHRVFVMGHSAGAYNAAMLALDPRWLAAIGLSPVELAGWIGLAGPYDFLPSDIPEVQDVFHHPHYSPGAQPIDHVNPDAPPAFLGAALQDSVVSPTRSTKQLAERLQAAGVAVTLRLYRGVNHLTLAGALALPLRFLAPVLDDVAGFVHQTVPLTTAEKLPADAFSREFPGFGE